MKKKMKNYLLVVFVCLCLFNIGLAFPAANLLPREKRSNSEAKSYVVKKEDSLWSISKKFGCNLKDLIESNQKTIGSNPDVIFPDMVLVLPKSCQMSRLSVANVQNKSDLDSFTLKKNDNKDTALSAHHTKSMGVINSFEKKIASHPDNKLNEDKSQKIESQKKKLDLTSKGSSESGFDFSIFNVLNTNSDINHSAYRNYQKSYSRSYSRSEYRSYSRSKSRSFSRSRSRSRGRSSSVDASRSKSVSISLSTSSSSSAGM